MYLRLAALAVPLVCGGCASVFHGTTERIAVTSDPGGARCDVWKGGTVVAQIAAPGTASIEKTGDTLTIVCDKPNYATGRAQLAAHRDPLGALDFLFLPLALIIDEITGASYQHDPSVDVSLSPSDPNKRVRTVPQN
jgi:hypothetical protein